MIDADIFHKTLSECFFENNITATGEQIEKLYRFADMLVETNKTLNLTAITDVEGICLKHFTDSLMALPYVTGSNVIDVGCGGGFPIIPLAIFLPDIAFTALDSTEKKLKFVEQAAVALGLSNVKCFCGRAEELSSGKFREKFDAVVSRAVSAMPVLSEICLGFLRIGGKMIALKSKNAKVEIEAAAKIVYVMGGSKQELIEYCLTHNGSSDSRSIILVSKVKSTPSVYPRHYSQILKKPL